jgi:hypothetical protein
MANLTELQRFYESVQTVPKLVSDLALSIAEAQRRMDVTYIQDLTDFIKLASQYLGSGNRAPETLIALFRAMGPTRYQFTETVLETRADLQMTTLSEATVGGTLGFNAPFAVSVNASYMRRSGLDARAAATIRTVLHAVSADQAVGQALLDAAQKATGATLPDSSRYKALDEVFRTLKEALPPAEEAAPATPASPEGEGGST